MGKKPLTLQDALRYSNHDLLNHLHLIQMNLDLNRVDEAKQLIHDIAENSKAFSMTNKLGQAKTAIWLQTFKWRYGAIELHLNGVVTQPISIEWDEIIEQYLEKTIIHVYDTLDPFVEQKLTIEVRSTEEGFFLFFHLTGHWEVEPYIESHSKLNVRMSECTTRSWRFEISLKE